ncbi:hypothetical protein D3C87_1715410 [compost metagenome]
MSGVRQACSTYQPPIFALDVDCGFGSHNLRRCVRYNETATRTVGRVWRQGASRVVLGDGTISSNGQYVIVVDNLTTATGVDNRWISQGWHR